MVQRIAAVVEYDGSRAHGFARQPIEHGITIQGAIDDALSSVAAQAIRSACAGRTDSGVHATAQVIHFDTDRKRPNRAWVDGVNANLPEFIRIRSAHPVDPEFHARFSARARRYAYVMAEGPERIAIGRDYVSTIRPDVDVERMQAAATDFLGTRDFSAVRAAACQARHPVRTVHAIDIRRRGGLIVLDIEANAFLLHMVRNVAGILLAIGRSELPIHAVRELLAGRSRRLAPPTASPNGLYLVEVRYPPIWQLPRGVRMPMFITEDGP